MISWDRRAASRLTLPLAGRHNISNALAALAAASVWGVGAAEATGSISEVAGDRHARPRVALRRRIFRDQRLLQLESRGAGRDDRSARAYSCAGTPHSCRRRNARTRALFAELHREAGRAAASAGNLDWIIGVQGDAESFVQRSDRSGPPGCARAIFPSSTEAAEFIRESRRAGRPTAGERFARREDGAHRRSARQAFPARMRSQCADSGSSAKERG